MLLVMLKSKVTVPRNSILETQFSKTSRIEIRIVFESISEQGSK